MVVAHIYVGEKLHRQFMAHAPRVGDLLRMPGGAHRQVAEVVWLLDVTGIDASTVNIRTTEAPPVPVTVTAAMVQALRDVSGAPLAECKAALIACGGGVPAAAEWIRTRGWSR